MGLQKFPTEILLLMCEFAAADGLSHVVNLSRASRRLHDVCTNFLHEKDVEMTGGLRSMSHGLHTGLNRVVERCLAAKVDPNLRIESYGTLDCCLLPVPKNPQHQLEGLDDDSTSFKGTDAQLENGGNAQEYDICEDTRIQAIKSVEMDKPRFQSGRAFYWTPLHVAASRNDVGLLELLLEYGADPNSAGRGVCPCHHRSIRRTLARSNSYMTPAQVEAERRLVTRWSPLHVAVCKASFSCAEILIGRFGLARTTESDDDVLAEADQIVRNPDDPGWLRRFGVTPRFDPVPLLHVAATNFGSVETFKKACAILQQARCFKGLQSSVDARDDFGDTLFAVAVLSGHAQTLGRYLLDNGAYINFMLRDVDGGRCSILKALCKSGLYGDALLLMDWGVDIRRDTKLHSGGPMATMLHISCGHDVNWRSLSYETIAKDKGLNRPENIKFIRRLIHAGVDVDARAEGGVTPLMSAARIASPDAIRELLKGKADVGVEDDKGWSALAWAVERGLTPRRRRRLDAVLNTIRTLLEYGADPNQCSKTKGVCPPLFSGPYALRCDRSRGRGDSWMCRDHFDGHYTNSSRRGGRRSSMASIAPLLISRGANPNIYLRRRGDLGDEGLAQLELDDPGSLVVKAFFLGEFDTVDSLLEYGTIVTYEDYLLMMRSLTDPEIRSFGSKTEVVESLFRILESPSLRLKRPHNRNSIMDAWTQLLYYAVGSRPKLVPVLARHVSLTDKCGPGRSTVLHALAQWKRKKNENGTSFERRVNEVLRGLLRCGAGRQINQPDNCGRSPLYVAVDRGNVPVAKALVDSGASVYIKHIKSDRSTMESPLELAIKRHLAGWWDGMAICIFDAMESKHGLESSYYRGIASSWNTLFSHFAVGPFYERMFNMGTPDTNDLVRKLIKLGTDVDQSDKYGNTALHVLTQLLLPYNGTPNEPGDAQDVTSSRPPRGSTSSPMGRKTSTDGDTELVSVLGRELDMDMDGCNIFYESDSDCEHYISQDPYDVGFDDFDSDDEGDISLDDDLGSYDFDSDDEGDTSLDDDVGFDDFLFDHEGGISPNDDLERSQRNAERALLLKYQIDPPPQCFLDRPFRGWASLFFCLLSSGASLTKKNNAGKTPTDYIDELRSCRVQAYAEAWRPIIPALRHFVKRPPFGRELSHILDGPEVKAKGQPILFVHKHISVAVYEDGVEILHQLERKMRSDGCTGWVPFW